MNPKPFCFNKSKVKAFVLGADPTNFSNKGKSVDLTYVFGIGQNPNYFRIILQNLNEIGLHLEDIYIQNLLPQYQEKETGKNTSFNLDASQNAKEIAEEFNKIDPTKGIPVFVTAYEIYNAIMSDGEKLYEAKELYSMKTEVPIPAEKNKLGRPLIPLFRHTDYQLEQHPSYKEHILKTISHVL